LRSRGLPAHDVENLWGCSPRLQQVVELSESLFYADIAELTLRICAEPETRNAPAPGGPFLEPGTAVVFVANSAADEGHRKDEAAYQLVISMSVSADCCRS
jgi:hypothetical protein